MGPTRRVSQSLIGSAILLLLATTAAHAKAPSQSAQEIAKRAFGVTVLLVMEDANGQPLSLGSGFFIRDGRIASNLHVVEGSGVVTSGDVV